MGDVLVDAGLMTDVPPCACGARINPTCVHHGPAWLRIRDNLNRGV